MLCNNRAGHFLLRFSCPVPLLRINFSTAIWYLAYPMSHQVNEEKIRISILLLDGSHSNQLSAEHINSPSTDTRPGYEAKEKVIP